MRMSNFQKGQFHKKKYSLWKKEGLRRYGYFVIFQGFLENKILSKISGNALKLYLYFGLNSNNTTGESYHSLDTISAYFGCSKRTVQNWIKELEKANLIKREQFEFNGVAHTFLQPYKLSIYNEDDIK